MRSLMMSVQNLILFTGYVYGGERIACNMCGSHGTITICRHDRRLKCLHWVACYDCGHIRNDPMPTEAELEAYHASEYRRDYQWSLSDSPPRFHRKRSAREAATRHAILAPVLKSSSSLLDFGSGSGEFLDMMQREGHIVTGIEPGESFAAHARKAYGVEVISKPWREVELPALPLRPRPYLHAKDFASCRTGCGPGGRPACRPARHHDRVLQERGWRRGRHRLVQ